MNTNAADSVSDIGAEGGVSTLAGLSLNSNTETETQVAATATPHKPSNFRQRGQFYNKPRRNQDRGGDFPAAERGRFQRRSFGFGRGGRHQSGHPFSTPGQTEGTKPGPSSAPNPNSHKYITKRRPPPRPENIKPNDVFINLKSNFRAHIEKCKKLLDGKYSEIHLHALADAIPVAINVAIELKKFFQDTVDFTTKTETVNLIDDLIPTDDNTAPTFAKRKISSVVVRVFRTINIP